MPALPNIVHAVLRIPLVRPIIRGVVNVGRDLLLSSNENALVPINNENRIVVAVPPVVHALLSPVRFVLRGVGDAIHGLAYPGMVALLHEQGPVNEPPNLLRIAANIMFPQAQQLIERPGGLEIIPRTHSFLRGMLILTSMVIAVTSYLYTTNTNFKDSINSLILELKSNISNPLNLDLLIRLNGFMHSFIQELKNDMLTPSNLYNIITRINGVIHSFIQELRRILT